MRSPKSFRPNGSLCNSKMKLQSPERNGEIIPCKIMNDADESDSALVHRPRRDLVVGDGDEDQAASSSSITLNEDDTSSSQSATTTKNRSAAAEGAQQQAPQLPPPSDSSSLECKICNKQFDNPHRLQRHAMSHDTSPELRKFKCEFCSKAFKFKHHLKVRSSISSFNTIIKITSEC